MGTMCGGKMPLQASLPVPKEWLCSLFCQWQDLPYLLSAEELWVSATQSKVSAQGNMQAWRYSHLLFRNLSIRGGWGDAYPIYRKSVHFLALITAWNRKWNVTENGQYLLIFIKNNVIDRPRSPCCWFCYTACCRHFATQIIEVGCGPLTSSITGWLSKIP